MKNIIVHRVVALGIAILLVTAAAFPRQMDRKIAQAQQQNADALRLYSWKSRTEIRREGETKNVQLTLVRYDRDGWIETTPISSTPEPRTPVLGLRGLIAHKEKENFKDTIDKLRVLAKSYGELSPAALQRFIDAANVSTEMDEGRNLLRFTGTNVLHLGDTMTLWIDEISRRQRRVEIHTNLNRKMVTITSEFKDLPTGPTYLARSVVDYASEKITVITENFEYQRTGGYGGFGSIFRPTAH